MSFVDRPTLRQRLAERMPDWLAGLLVGLAWIIWLPVTMVILDKVAKGGCLLLFILMLPILAIATTIALVIVVVGLISAAVRIPLSLSSAFKPAFGFLLGVVLFLPVAWGVQWSLGWGDLVLHHGQWRRIALAPAMPPIASRWQDRYVTETAADAPASSPDAEPFYGWLESDGVTYMVDQTDPRRVAFLDKSYFLDGWSGYVFDPTGRARLVKGGRGPAERRNWFGGGLYGCSEMAWDFDYCSFA